MSTYPEEREKKHSEFRKYLAKLKEDYPDAFRGIDTLQMTAYGNYGGRNSMKIDEKVPEEMHVLIQSKWDELFVK
jgi:hypothetical protein